VNGLHNDAEAATAKLIQTGQELERCLRTPLLTSQLKISEADAAELAQALEEKRIEAGHYAQGVKDRLAEIENLSTMLRETYASHSWRVTRPLRFFGRALRKVVRILRRIAGGIALAAVAADAGLGQQAHPVEEPDLFLGAGAAAVRLDRALPAMAGHAGAAL
jgi:hypothetical protein